MRRRSLDSVDAFAGFTQRERCLITLRLRPRHIDVANALATGKLSERCPPVRIHRPFLIPKLFHALGFDPLHRVLEIRTHTPGAMVYAKQRVLRTLLDLFRIRSVFRPHRIGHVFDIGNHHRMHMKPSFLVSFPDAKTIRAEIANQLLLETTELQRQEFVRLLTPEGERPETCATGCRQKLNIPTRGSERFARWLAHLVFSDFSVKTLVEFCSVLLAQSSVEVNGKSEKS